MIGPETRIRLRPSVAFVPLGSDQYQFFQGNTRRSRTYRLDRRLAEIIRQLDGQLCLGELAAVHRVDVDSIVQLGMQLGEHCFVEHVDVAARIAASPWRRVVNFLADFYPSVEVEQQFRRLQDTPVIILGAGAVGSWIAQQLAQSGFHRFALIDDDLVERSNLNRSLYFEGEIGLPKVEALGNRLQATVPGSTVSAWREQVADAGQLTRILVTQPTNAIVVNCADFPNVDATSAIVDQVCQRLRMPYVIAGGYNLHLSLIGMTVIPGESACYHCGRVTLDERQASDLDELRKLKRPWRNVGNVAPLAAITSSFAANEVIRLAVRSSRLRPRMLNRRGEFNFLTNQLHFVALPPRAECNCQRASCDHD